MDPDTVRHEWSGRSGAYSPEYYAHLGPNETSEAIRSTLLEFLDVDASVLELGCSSGRHLAHLAEHGFRNLHGVEINDEAFDVMADEYPDLFDDGEFHRTAIGDAVPEFDDGQFDAVFSVETIQHLPPERAWVFDDLARITCDVLITVENEGDDGDVGEVNYVDDEFPLYYRNWQEVFAECGLDQVNAEQGKRDTRRVFRVDVDE